MGGSGSKATAARRTLVELSDTSHSTWDDLGATHLKRFLIPVADRDSPKAGYDFQIRLVNALYLIKLAESGGTLLRRQDAPEEAFLSLDEMEQMDAVQVNYRGASLRVILISAPWLTPDHPDPDGTNLRSIARMLKDAVDAVGGTFGVFISFMSLHQQPRRPFEEKLFEVALNGLSEWYAHPKTIVAKVTSPPMEDARTSSSPSGVPSPKKRSASGVMQRPWCFLEAAAANLVKHNDFILDLSRSSGKVTVPQNHLAADHLRLHGLMHAYVDRREPPLCPRAFGKRLQSKAFANERKERRRVLKLYQAAFVLQWKLARELNYAFNQWDNEDAATLAESFRSAQSKKLLHKLTTLALNNNQLTCDGVATLAQSFGKGALPRLERLFLNSNLIGDLGMKSLVASCVWSGALEKLVELNFYNNKIGDKGLAAFAEALSHRSKPLAALQTLWLNNNSFGSEGLIAFADVLPKGQALARLEFLWLNDNTIGDRGLTVLSRSVSEGGLAALKELYLYNNRIGSSGMRALRDAVNKGAMPKLDDVYLSGNSDDSDPVDLALRQRQESAHLDAENVINVDDQDSEDLALV